MVLMPATNQTFEEMAANAKKIGEHCAKCAELIQNVPKEQQFNYDTIQNALIDSLQRIVKLEGILKSRIVVKPGASAGTATHAKSPSRKKGQ